MAVTPAQWTGTFSQKGVKMTVSGQALINALLPHLITALSTNATLRNALVTAIMPSVRSQVATITANTAGGKKPGK